MHIGGNLLVFIDLLHDFTKVWKPLELLVVLDELLNPDGSKGRNSESSSYQILNLKSFDERVKNVFLEIERCLE